MKNIKNELLLLKDDYHMLISYLRAGQEQTYIDRKYARELEAEIKKARLVDKKDFPNDVVRLNSKVKIKGEGTRKFMELMLVAPDQADIQQRKISIMAPLGTALIGFRQGAKVQWPVPSGMATFTIMEVVNDDQE